MGQVPAAAPILFDVIAQTRLQSYSYRNDMYILHTSQFCAISHSLHMFAPDSLVDPLSGACVHRYVLRNIHASLLQIAHLGSR